MLLRLAYLAMTNTFALLRLLPMGSREKDIEILALRHQLPVLQRQVGKPGFSTGIRIRRPSVSRGYTGPWPLRGTRA
ncbi:hypothetical protein [Kitasatospora aureofaciens]|uniref:hypothetical protein n=1 Tax=Kitasatospora aureofaciens TaxID=1894 RepID=UPI00052617C1|nr:hypothetical protein [Kitasatospora aureofaciens]